MDAPKYEDGHSGKDDEDDDGRHNGHSQRGDIVAGQIVDCKEKKLNNWIWLLCAEKRKRFPARFRGDSLLIEYI